MQDQIIASHTWTVKPVSKRWSEMDYKHTCDTIYTYF